MSHPDEHASSQAAASRQCLHLLNILTLNSTPHEPQHPFNSLSVALSTMQPLSLVLLCASFAFVTGHQHDDPAPVNASGRVLKPTHFPELGAKRVRVEYGSHIVNASAMSNFHAPIPSPCDDCLITYMQAQLQYPNGTTADADNGLWMHHVVFFNGNRSDTVCPTTPQRFFASGNERSPVDLTVSHELDEMLSRANSRALTRILPRL